jgi:tetratricopeptide (TPR) repeat protein
VPWSLFSLQHILDIFNNILLHAPFAAAVFIAWLVGRQKEASPSRELQFASIAAVFWLALIISHSAIARDWDVYALFGVSFALTAFFLVGRFSDAAARRYYYRQMIIQPVLFLIPWVGINSDALSGVNRLLDFTAHYEDILPVEVTAGCYETVREFNANVKNYEGEVIMLRKILELRSSRYDYYKLARAFNKERKYTNRELAVAEASMKDILALPDSVRRLPCGESGHEATVTLNDVYIVLAVARSNGADPGKRSAWLDGAFTRLMEAEGGGFRTALTAAKTFSGMREFDMAMKWFGTALADSAQADREGEYTVPRLYTAMAVSYLEHEELDKALEYFRTAANHPYADYKVVNDYAYGCYLMRHYEESEQAFRRVLKVNPGDRNALYYIGRMCLARPETRQEGRRLLDELIARYPNTDFARSARKLIIAPPESLPEQP